MPRTGALCLLFLAVQVVPAQRLPQADRFAWVLDSVVVLGVPGIQAHVTVAGRSWTGAAGLASVEGGEAMTTRQRLRLASVTKMMTYAATMELARRGRLSLGDRAVSLLPARALQGIPHADEMTLEQLLNHTSGLHNYNGENGAAFFHSLFTDTTRGMRRWRPEELVAFARDARHPPTGRPGERRSYSSTGYSVLEMVMTSRHGAPLSQVFRDLVFAPLGMTRAGIEGQDLSSNDIADSYARPAAADATRPSPFGMRKPVRDDGLVNLSTGLRYYTAWPGAGGAVAATIEDLIAFMRGVRGGTVTVLHNQDAEFAAARAKANVFLSWNGGSWGIQSSIIYEPGRDITVIVLTNATNVGAGSHDIARRLLELARQ